MFELFSPTYERAEQARKPADSTQETRDTSHEPEVRRELERIAPGALNYLRSEAHIENFARYPLDVLVDMYKTKDRPGP